VEIYGEFDGGAAGGLALDDALAAAGGEAAGEVAEAVAGLGAAGLVIIFAVAGGTVDGGSEALAVVFDDEGERRRREAEADFDLSGAGVLDDVVEGFLDGKEKVVADFGA
jgi:hypothetical protein